jgi:hypothetical protein
MKTKLILFILLNFFFTISVSAMLQGAGTVANPYLVSSLADLRYISENNSLWSAQFEQTSNIDAQATIEWNTTQGFLPIGSSAVPFTGKYDGKGFSIFNLTINRPTTSNVGLFGYVSGGTIKNVNLIGANIIGGDNWIGGIAGRIEVKSIVSYCNTSGNVKGTSNVGGLVGYAHGNGTIIDHSRSSATVRGSVSGTYKGGLVGHITSSAVVRECYAEGSVNGRFRVGGLIGAMGWNSLAENSFAKGQVAMLPNQSLSWIGGLVGEVWQGRVVNCYSLTSVSIGSALENYGGLVGLINTGGNFLDSNNFWNTTTSGLAVSAMGQGKTPEEMKQKETYIGWNFTTIWDINPAVNNGYPYLRNEQITLWTGGNSNDAGDDSGNWNNNNAPDSTTSVIVAPSEDEDPVYPVFSNPITINNLQIQPGAVITNNDTLTILGNIILEVNDDLFGGIYNNGTIVNKGRLVVRRTFKANAGWHFVSFPYDVTADRVFIAGTGFETTWGDLADYPNADFYVQEYDGVRRDLTGAATVTNSPNWKNVVPKTFVKNRGYIIAVGEDITLDFVSVIGESDLFAKQAQIDLQKSNNNPSLVHRSWNLGGNPFSSPFNLRYATQTHAPYYYFNGNTYVAVMAHDDFVVPSYATFFVQAHGNEQSLVFEENGRNVRALSVPEKFEQLSLTIQDNSNNQFSDVTRIRLQEGRTTEFELGKDAVKMLSTNALVPQIYTQSRNAANINYSYAVNALPLTTTLVDLVVTTGKAGSYTISLENIDDAPSYSSIILVVGTKEYDLTKQGYTFTTTKAQTFSWKVKLVQGVTTQVAQTTENGIDVATINKHVYITGLQSEATVYVYTVSGKLVEVISNVQNNQALTINNIGVSVLSITTTTQQTQAKVLIE